MGSNTSRAGIWGVRLGLLALLVVVWELLGIAEGGLFLPRATTTFDSFFDLLGTSELWGALGRSNMALLVGFPIALVLGVPVGLLVGRVRALDRYFGYYLDLLLVIPMIALVPVIIAVFGLSLTARVVVVALFALPVIAMNARASVRVLNMSIIEMARSFGARWRQTWTSVILPSAAGPIFAGVRLGLSRAVSGMIVVELTLVPAGLGGLIVNFRSEFSAAPLYATTMVIIAEGILVVALARWLEGKINQRLRGVRI